jgi:hypothetical protein
MNISEMEKMHPVQEAIGMLDKSYVQALSINTTLIRSKPLQEFLVF